MPVVEEVLLASPPGETRMALVAGGRVVEFIIDRGDAAPGEVILGRVSSVNRALGAAFVEIGEAQAGFLGSAGAATEGESLLVQVTAQARGAKGAELTRAVSLAGRFLAYSPSRPGLSISRRIANEAERTRLSDLLKPLMAASEGAVVRTDAAEVPAEDLLAELASLRQRWQAITETAAKATPPFRLHAPHPLEAVLAAHPGIHRLLVDSPGTLAKVRPLFSAAELHRDGPLFELYDAEETLEAALSPRVALPGGGALIIEAAAALTVVDIDSGRGSPAEANLAAVPEIARQLRLRAIAGHVMVDVIPMRDRRALGRVTDALQHALAADPTPTQLVGVTPLGMIEITRERRRPTLAEMMLEQPPPRRNAETTGLAALEALLREATARPGANLALVAAPDVSAALRRRPNALAEAALSLGRPVVLDDQPGLEGYDLVEVKK